MTNLACSFKEMFDVKFHYSNYGKKNGQMQVRIMMRRLFRNNTIHHYHPAYKYDYSSLHVFTEIFDEIFHYLNYGKKEN